MPDTFDLAMVPIRPSHVFGRLQNVPGAVIPLFALMMVSLLCSLITIKTGLLERYVEAGVQEQLGEVEEAYHGNVNKIEFRQRAEEIDKSATFALLAARGGLIIESTLWILTWVLGLSAFFFGVVSLRGAKAEWYTLLGAVTFAASTDVLHRVIKTALMLYHKTLEIDLSFASLLTEPVVSPTGENVPYLFLAAGSINPFDLWFWALLRTGLVSCGQLKPVAATLTCVLFWLISTGVRFSLGMATFGAFQGS